MKEVWIVFQEGTERHWVFFNKKRYFRFLDQNPPFGEAKFKVFHGEVEEVENGKERNSTDDTA